MPFQNLESPRLKVAIIGSGPAGLGAAIELSRLPFVEWDLYEQATAIREIGAGISIQPSTWRLLEHLGVAANLTAEDFYRPADNHSVQHRNGRTGEILVSHSQDGIPGNQLHARTHRSKLQRALLKEVDESHVHLSKRLTSVKQRPSGKLLLEFQDGFEGEVDLLVGADGVRSVVRNFAFPDHQIGYIGRVSYRTVISTEEAATVTGLPDAVTFWHGPDSWLYTCPLGDRKFEITTMTKEPAGGKEKVSWGQDATIEDNARHFEDFCPVAKEIIAVSKDLKQYALFAGSRLESVIAYGSVALVGDASHPLSGAFGSGAGFALEDIYVLANAVTWAYEWNLTLQDSLRLFDQVRGPYYRDLYSVLDNYAQVDEYLRNAHLSFDDTVNILVERKWSKKTNWIAEYDIQRIFKEAVQRETSRRSGLQESSRL